MALILSLLSLASAFKVDPQSTYFVDDLGRFSLFHGVNVVVKVPPYLPITDQFDPQMSLNAEDITNLQKWGFNFVRLGVMWQAVETAPGVYDTDYLQQTDALIRQLGAAGIYTLVDAHQDLLLRKLCGEGVPSFYFNSLDSSCDYNVLSKVMGLFKLCKTMKEFDLTYGDDGYPTVDSCLKHPFPSYYQTAEVSSAFEQLFNNTDGVLDHFLGFWNVVAGAFKDNPYVLGYDILNEPLAANWWRDISLLFPQKFDRDVLTAFYEKANAVIRTQTTDQQVFFQPPQTDVLPFFNGLVQHVGFPHAPGSEENLGYQVLNDHTYCCQIAKSICATGEPSLSDAKTCKDFHERRITARAEDAKRLKTGLFFTEFGACSDSVECAQEITSVTEACDNNLVSWAYWLYKGYNDFTTTGSLTEGLYYNTGAVQSVKLAALSRTYAQYVQGTPVSMKFDVQSKAFELVYSLDASIQGPTVIYLNEEVHYPNGYVLTVTNNKGYSVTPKTAVNSVAVQYSADLPHGVSQTTLTITPK
jgi:endoglycosylceramidase